MRLSTLWQKMGYRVKAKSRHGIHSPFVYNFIEQVLLRKRQVRAIAGTCLNEKQQYLLETIWDCYQPGTLICDGRSLIVDEQKAGTLFLLTQNDVLPGQYSENDIVLIAGIYKDAGQAKTWQQLVENSAVPLSIDVFEMGILFFKKEFRIKQHFILKYR